MAEIKMVGVKMAEVKMAEVKILIEGYAKKFEKGWVASSTTCLIIAKNKKIITDPGCNREKLLTGRVVIAGDVIWWTEGEKQVFDINQKDHSQAKGMDTEKLKESRKKVLKIADYIIPGHGKMFKVEKYDII